jgi:fatty acid desaturase
MLSWGTDDCTHLRVSIFQIVGKIKYAKNFYGRSFFFSTLLLAIISEVFISFAVSINSLLLICLAFILNGFIFLRFQFILHEASHGVLSSNKIENDMYGKVAGCISGYPFKLYRTNHSKHHIHTGSNKDIEFDNFLTDEGPPVWLQFIIKILKCFLLIDALKLIRQLFKIDILKGDSSKNNLFLFVLILILQLSLLSFFTFPNILLSITSFLIFALSILSLTFTLNRFRAMCEHSSFKELDYYGNTRSHKKNLFTFLISPINFNFHLEHHLFPDISSYYYPLINKKLLDNNTNQSWLSDSYLSTLIIFFKK